MHSVAPLVRCLFLHIVRYASDVCLIFLIFQFSICGFQGTVCSVSVLSLLKTSGDGEIRTLDPLLARQVLSQLSYTPKVFKQIVPFKQVGLFNLPLDLQKVHWA